MSKTYWFTFSTQDPRTYTGLSPTFVSFVNQLGATLAPPGVTEVFTGFYKSNYTVGASTSVAFLLDGGATLSTSVRYITGNIFGTENIDYMGSTILAIGATVSSLAGNIGGIGATTDSFGTTNVDPGTLFGYVKRLQENLEGNQTFLKSSGLWSIYSRGSSTLLATKTMTSDVTGVTRI